MKRLQSLSMSLAVVLLSAAPAFAQSAQVDKVQNFMTNIVQILVTLAGTLAAIFFVIGGISYITSSGHPEKLDQAKKTLMYSGIGLAVCIAAFVIMNLVTDVAKNAFS